MNAAGCLIFDLDGTLYDQRMLRGRMVRELLRRNITSPLRLIRTVRILNAYRQAQEGLRASSARASAQLDSACRRCGYSRVDVEQCVEEWMVQAPLQHLTSCMPAGLIQRLEAAHAAGVKMAVCSDYPARAKLAAMGIEHLFHCVIAAQDTDVDRFKPDPRMLQAALDRLNMQASDAFYFGDREDVDGGAARRAGIPFRIVHHPSELVDQLKTVF